MPAIKRLILDLPEDAVTAIEADVASGRYADASEAVTAAVRDHAADDGWEDTPEFQAWLAEGDEVDRQMESGEDPGIPAEQVFAELKAELRAMMDADSARK